MFNQNFANCPPFSDMAANFAIYVLEYVLFILAVKKINFKTSEKLF